MPVAQYQPTSKTGTRFPNYAVVSIFNLQTDSRHCSTAQIADPIAVKHRLAASRHCAAERDKEVVVQMKQFELYAECFFVPLLSP